MVFHTNRDMEANFDVYKASMTALVPEHHPRHRKQQ